jgi:hypothetical protein
MPKTVPQTAVRIRPFQLDPCILSGRVNTPLGIMVKTISLPCPSHSLSLIHRIGIAGILMEVRILCSTHPLNMACGNTLGYCSIILSTNLRNVFLSPMISRYSSSPIGNLMTFEALLHSLLFGYNFWKAY